VTVGTRVWVALGTVVGVLETVAVATGGWVVVGKVARGESVVAVNFTTSREVHPASQLPKRLKRKTTMIWTTTFLFMEALPLTAARQEMGSDKGFGLLIEIIRRLGGIQVVGSIVTAKTVNNQKATIPKGFYTVQSS
jgi:hypothetical protein